MLQQGHPIERIQSSVHDYITAENFQKNYPNAYQKWLEAVELLWSTDSEKQLTTIGHHCRETMQEFATYLVDKYKPSEVDSDKARHISRLRSVLSHNSAKLGKTIPPFLEALVAYWGTLNDLIQRQEHAGQKEGDPVNWEDARRIVFQTAIVMYEIDRSLSL